MSDDFPIGPSKEMSFSLTPKNLEEAMKYADIIAASDIVPPDYKGKPANILVAMQMGLEIGLPALQAIQNIAVIRGRPSLWGDSLMAVAQSHPSCEYINETFDESTMTATCRAKRKGKPEQVRTFSQKDAETAKLWDQNVWKSYPKRMLQMRARGFAIRDTFADALRGMASAEEMTDMEPRDMGNADVVIEPEAPKALPDYLADKFSKSVAAWEKLINSGKKTPTQIIATISNKYTLNEDQIKTINDLAEPAVIDGDFVAEYEQGESHNA